MAAKQKRMSKKQRCGHPDLCHNCIEAEAIGVYGWEPAERKARRRAINRKADCRQTGAV